MSGFNLSIPSVVLLVIVLGSASVDSLFANSYGYVYLAESELPSKIVEVAVFRASSPARVTNGRGEVLEKGDLVPDSDVIRDFFAHGVWSFQKPLFGAEQWLNVLEERADTAARAFSEINFPDASEEEARKSELDQFATEYRQINSKVRRISGSEGAVLDDKGSIFLWRLLAPTLMEVYRNADQLCYLRVADRNAAILRDREVPEKKLRKPLVSGDEFSVSPDFRPGTGENFPLGREIVKEFLDRGEITESGSKHIQYAVTEFRIPITQYTHREQEWSRDILGNRIVIGPLVMNGQCNGIFVDEENSLWRAELLSDCHLQVDDGEGRVFILAISEILEKGHGKPVKEAGRRVGG